MVPCGVFGNSDSRYCRGTNPVRVGGGNAHCETFGAFDIGIGLNGQGDRFRCSVAVTPGEGQRGGDTGIIVHYGGGAVMGLDINSEFAYATAYPLQFKGHGA